MEEHLTKLKTNEKGEKKVEKIKQIKQKKSNKGITLIALVITIIVLLILAAVSIATLTGENGILTKANDAKDQSKAGEEKEQIKLAYNAAMADNYEKGDYTSGVTASQLQEHLDKLNAKATVTEKDGKLLVEFEGGNSYEIDGKTGEITESKVNTSETSKTVEDLKVGDWVIYESEKGNIPCIVLYDTEYNYNSKSKTGDYGVQIISADVVKDDDGNDLVVKLGNGEGKDIDNNLTSFQTATNSYNNAITYLNEIAEQYVNKNTDFVEQARCVGSVPNDMNYESEYLTNFTSPLLEYNGKYKDEDNNYTTDCNQMRKIKIDEFPNGICNINKEYWLASRVINFVNTSAVRFGVRWYKEYDGPRFFIGVFKDDSVERSSFTESGFRPVFTLKSGTKIVGEGINQEDAYRLIE